MATLSSRRPLSAKAQRQLAIDKIWQDAQRELINRLMRLAERDKQLHTIFQPEFEVYSAGVREALKEVEEATQPREERGNVLQFPKNRWFK